MAVFQKGRSRQQIDIGIEGAREDPGSAVPAANFREAGETFDREQRAQRALHRPGELQEIGIGVSGNVSGHRQRQNQCPLQHTAPGKGAVHDQPCAGHAHHQHAGAHGHRDTKRVEQVLGQHRIEHMRQHGMRIRVARAKRRHDAEHRHEHNQCGNRCDQPPRPGAGKTASAPAAGDGRRTLGQNGIDDGRIGGGAGRGRR